jgi:dTMP kinase
LRGKFITFEGIDGSGKTTQLRMLASDLRVKGFNVLTTMEPGGTPLGRRLREAFLETEENVSPLAELLLFAADRAQHIDLLIKPAIQEGKIVISDRFADATFAYQGAGRGFPERLVNQVIKLATGGLKPDLTLFFDVSIDKALMRTKSRSKSGEKINRMDFETTEFYGRVRAAYLQILEKEPKRFVKIDANSSVEEIHQRVLQIITDFLAKAESQTA